MNAADWSLLALAAFAVVAVTGNLRLDFLDHLTDVRRILRHPGGHTEPGLALDVAQRIQAQATQAMPPLVPTGIVRIWRDNGELFATEGIAWGPNAPLVVCRDPENPHVWAVIHRPTGGVIRSNYGEPEEALMAVNRLNQVCDWASPEAVTEWEQVMKEEVA